MVPGSVAHFSDGQKAHTGVVLDVSEDGDAWALFLTSNPLWNKQCRAMTPDELALCGFSRRDGVQTYFAPVIRPARDAFHSGVTLPDHRVLDLMEEFGPSPFLPPAVSLPPEIFPPVRAQKPVFPERCLAHYFDREVFRIGATKGWTDDEGKRLGKVCWGLEDMPRSELQVLCSMLPAITKFFIRRPSVTVSLQKRWSDIGSILAEYRESRSVPAPLMARRMGIPDKEYRGFENGLLCPSYGEMLTIQALLPGIPDGWTLPTSVPLLADCLLIQLLRRKWRLNQVASRARIPLSRVDDIFIMAQKPKDHEMEKLRILFRDLPPWRPCYRMLDHLGPMPVEGGPATHDEDEYGFGPSV